MKVVGFREVNYTSKNTGQPVRGMEIHGTYPSSRALAGLLTDNKFVSLHVIEKMGGRIPEIGDEIEFSYNQFGKIDRYEIL